MEIKCENCKYFSRFISYTGFGYCYRFPPIAEHGWPTVHEINFCGEFIPTRGSSNHSSYSTVQTSSPAVDPSPEGDDY